MASITDLSDINVLVSAGSKHGATAEIADSIGKTLAGRGLDVTVAKPEEITNIANYQAVVLGSGVYAGHWTKAAKNLAHRVVATHPKPNVWLFSSGPVGDPGISEEDPVDVSEIVEATAAREHRVFAGKIDGPSSASGRRRS